MDEVKIESFFMKSIVSKFINSILRKKLHIDLGIMVKELEVKVDDSTRGKISFDFEMPKSSLIELVRRYQYAGDKKGE